MRGPSSSGLASIRIHHDDPALMVCTPSLLPAGREWLASLKTFRASVSEVDFRGHGREETGARPCCLLLPPQRSRYQRPGASVCWSQSDELGIDTRCLESPWLQGSLPQKTPKTDKRRARLATLDPNTVTPGSRRRKKVSRSASLHFFQFLSLSLTLLQLLPPKNSFLPPLFCWRRHQAGAYIVLAGPSGRCTLHRGRACPHLKGDPRQDQGFHPPAACGGGGGARGGSGPKAAAGGETQAKAPRRGGGGSTQPGPSPETPATHRTPH